MRSDYTHIIAILDRSGSMGYGGRVEDTIGGFNTFLKEQQAVPGKGTLSLVLFNDSYLKPCDFRDLAAVEPLTRATYRPEGNTALLDAMARAITEDGLRLEKTSEHERPSRVVVLVITDDLENASIEYSERTGGRAKVNAMVELQKTVYNWQFSFIGTNQNAQATAGSVGIDPANALTYANNAVGINHLYAAVTNNLRSFRMGRADSMAFTEQQREEQKAAQ